MLCDEDEKLSLFEESLFSRFKIISSCPMWSCESVTTNTVVLGTRVALQGFLQKHMTPGTCLLPVLVGSTAFETC